MRVEDNSRSLSDDALVVVVPRCAPSPFVFRDGLDRGAMSASTASKFQPSTKSKSMAVPIQLTTNVQNETFGGVTYHIEGELVPALHLELSHNGVYFEHHILLWKDPAVQIALHPMKGAFKRMLAGMPFMLTGANGPGRIAFSRDGAGRHSLVARFWQRVRGYPRARRGD
jgi:hypothetical protein